MTLDQILDQIHEKIPGLVSSIEQNKEFLFFDYEGSLCGRATIVHNGFNIGIEYQKVKDPFKRNKNEKETTTNYRRKSTTRYLPSGD